jgi:hypothetical protein
MDRTAKHWKDVPQLHDLPLLAINVANDTQDRFDKNEPLFKKQKTGDWNLPAEVAAHPKGKFVMLFYGVKLREGLKRKKHRIYIGTIKSIRPCKPLENPPRYVITIENPWLEVAETDVSFKQFMDGFVFNPRHATHWIDGRLDASVPALSVEEEKQIQRQGKASKKAIVLRRMGHHRYAQDVKEKWGNECALTGADARHMLEAAHLTPWDHSGSSDNINASNGLCLCSHLHSMLDNFQIAFDGNGRLHIDSRLSAKTRKVLLASGNVTLRTHPDANLRVFLEKNFKHAKKQNRNLHPVATRR